MSTAALPQLQVLLDHAHSFPAPTPPNSASTIPSDSPDSADPTAADTVKSSNWKRVVNLSSPASALPTGPGTPDQTPEAEAIKASSKSPGSPSPSPLDQIKPPPTPRPWLWQCHRCYTEYRVACTRRCFECGHEFCTGTASVNNSSSSSSSKTRGPCRSQFDFAGWEAWGSFRRTVALLASGRSAGTKLNMKSSGGGGLSGAGADTASGSNNKRRKKGADDQLPLGTKKKAPGESGSTFATWTPATETIHDLRRGWVDSIVQTKGKTMPWQAVTAEERDVIMRNKEKMYVRREYNCWVHCDAPSECRLAVYTACSDGRARLAGNGKLTAVLLEDVSPKNMKKGKKKMSRKEKKKAAAAASRSESEETLYCQEEQEDEGNEQDKECVIMKKLRKTKNQLLYGADGRPSGQRPSTEITTEHVEDRQAEEYEPPADMNSILKTETESGERTTSIPRQLLWPSSEAAERHENGTPVTDPTTPTGLLATLISGGDSEVDLGALPLENDHDDLNPGDVEFAELVPVSSNLVQSTANITSSSSSSSSATTTLVSPPSNSFTIIRVDEADHHHHHMPSAEPAAREPGRHVSSSETTCRHGPPPIHQPPKQIEGFVDLKEVINIGYLQDRRAKSKKRQRSDHSHEGQSPTATTTAATTCSTAEYSPDEIFCPSPIKFKIPIWKDQDTDDDLDDNNMNGNIDSIASEYSAAELMDILCPSEPESSSDSHVSSAVSSRASSGSELEDMTTTMRDDAMGISESLEYDARQPISPSPDDDMSPTSVTVTVSHEHDGPNSIFSSIDSPLSPEFKMHSDLSMYLDEEIMSPVSIAAARSLGGGGPSLHVLDEQEKIHVGVDNYHNSNLNMGENDNDNAILITVDDQSKNEQSDKSKSKDNLNMKDNREQCELLLTLCKMQSAFLGGRDEEEGERKFW